MWLALVILVHPVCAFEHRAESQTQMPTDAGCVCWGGGVGGQDVKREQAPQRAQSKERVGGRYDLVLAGCCHMMK